MTVLASSNFDAGTTGNSVPTNGTFLFNVGSFAVGGTCTFDTAHVHSGKAAKFHTASGTDAIYREYDLASAIPTLVVGGYYYWTGLPSATVTLITLYSGATKIADLRVTTTGAI